VIYSYSTSQRDTLFLIFIFDKELHMFRGRFTVHHQESQNCIHSYTAIGICHASYVECLLARSGWFHPDLASRQST